MNTKETQRHMKKTKQQEWEEAMLEENSYYDIDIINKANAPIFRKIEKWEVEYAKASSWLGKWYCQIQIDKWKKRLHHYK
jgi:hypothetical protein